MLAIVQARMGSTRLPGKVLRTAAGKTFLHHLTERLRGARRIERIVVATSDLAADDPIGDECRKIGVDCFRGSERDVLDRYYRAASSYGAGTVVRITADCPLIDPSIVDRVVAFQQSHSDAFDLVTNRYPLTFPDGLDVDVMPMRALADAWSNARTQQQREHVIPYFWETGQRVKNIECAENLFPDYRWTVDYEEDALLVAAIFEALHEPGAIFGMQEILTFVRASPEIAQWNAMHLPQRQRGESAARPGARPRVP